MSIGEMIDEAVEKADRKLALHVISELARKTPMASVAFVSHAVNRGHAMESVMALLCPGAPEAAQPDGAGHE